MIARLREHWRMRGRAAELARWNAGHRSGCPAQPMMLRWPAHFGQIDAIADERHRIRELFVWNQRETSTRRVREQLAAQLLQGLHTCK